MKNVGIPKQCDNFDFRYYFFPALCSNNCGRGVKLRQIRRTIALTDFWMGDDGTIWLLYTLDLPWSSTFSSTSTTPTHWLRALHTQRQAYELCQYKRPKRHIAIFRIEITAIGISANGIYLCLFRIIFFSLSLRFAHIYQALRSVIYNRRNSSNSTFLCICYFFLYCSQSLLRNCWFHWNWIWAESWFVMVLDVLHTFVGRETVDSCQHYYASCVNPEWKRFYAKLSIKCAN